MSKPPSATSIRRWVWAVGDDIRIPGAAVRTSRYMIFIPRDQLRTYADFMHDAADDYDQNEQEKETA